MPKSDLKLGDAEYALVADRIALFYRHHPTGRIITELVARTDREVTFRALVYRGAEDAAPAATGWASEREGDGDVNTVACLENTETSAIGRALANLGFTASRQRASREEMDKAARARPLRVAEGRPAVAAPLGPRGAPTPLRPAQRPPEAPLPDGEIAVGGGPPPTRAAAVADVLSLLERAEREGMTGEWTTTVRARLADARTSVPTIERYERRLRRWLAGRADDRLTRE